MFFDGLKRFDGFSYETYSVFAISFCNVILIEILSSEAVSSKMHVKYLYWVSGLRLRYAAIRALKRANVDRNTKLSKRLAVIVSDEPFEHSDSCSYWCALFVVLTAKIN